MLPPVGNNLENIGHAAPGRAGPERRRPAGGRAFGPTGSRAFARDHLLQLDARASASKLESLLT